MNQPRKSFTTSFPAGYYLFEFIKPRKKALNFPSSFVPLERSAILGWGLLAILPVRRDEFNSLASKGFIKRIAVIGTIPNNSSGSSHRDNFIEGSLDKSDFMRVSRIRVHGDR